jgi:carbon storage regulator
VLVLTRRKNQSIVIGDDVVVTVLEVKGDQIRLGITAPREIQVYREELLSDPPARNQRSS